MLYIHVARGSGMINETILVAGDGATIQGESVVNMTGIEKAEILIFDLPESSY